VRRRLLIALAAALCACSPAAAATGRTAGEPLQEQEWWLAHIGADPAAAPPPGVPITIVDSGVDPAHPEFAGRPNTTFLDDQTVDGTGEYHGTIIASLAGAPVNGAGIVGVYPQAVLQSWDASPTPVLQEFSLVDGIRAA
jgi:subtilisin family serine protease